MESIRAHPVRSALLATPPGFFVLCCTVAQCWPAFTDQKIPDWFRQNVAWIFVKYPMWQIWLCVAGALVVYALAVYLLFRPRPKTQTLTQSHSFQDELSKLGVIGQSAEALKERDCHADREALLDKIVADINHISATPYMPAGYKTGPLTAMLNYYSDFKSEEDVTYVCDELESLNSLGNIRCFDPFLHFESVYGKGAFDRKRLKLMRDLRMGAVNTDSDVDIFNFLENGWAEKNNITKLPITSWPLDALLDMPPSEPK